MHDGVHNAGLVLCIGSETWEWSPRLGVTASDLLDAFRTGGSGLQFAAGGASKKQRGDGNND